MNVRHYLTDLVTLCICSNSCSIKESEREINASLFHVTGHDDDDNVKVRSLSNKLSVIVEPPDKWDDTCRWAGMTTL